MRGMDGDVATAAAAPRRLPCRRPCRPPKQMVNVTGTANVAAGYRMRRLPEPRPGPTKLATSLVGRYEPPTPAEQEQKVLASLRDTRIQEKKIIKRDILRRVELGMDAYEADLEARRDRLRELLLREETGLVRELIEACQRRENERLAQLQESVNEDAEERERERQRLIEEKRLQIFAQSSQKLRDALGKAWTEDAKRVNLEQIHDAEEQRRREQEHEAFWHELMRKCCLEGEAAAAEEARRRAARERDVAETQLGQMRAKSARPPSAEPESFVFGREPDEEARRAKNLAWREELERQILEARRELERRREEELALDRMSASFGAPARDDRDKETRRREILAFMDSMREFREAVGRREREAEECLGRLAAEAEARRSEERRRAREDRARIERELRLTWDRQLAERREAERREHQRLRDNCRESTAEDPEVARAERARRHQAHLEYGRELLAQQERTVARRTREERETDELYARLDAEREQEERRLVQQLVPARRVSVDR